MQRRQVAPLPPHRLRNACRPCIKGATGSRQTFRSFGQHSCINSELGQGRSRPDTVEPGVLVRRVVDKWHLQSSDEMSEIFAAHLQKWTNNVEPIAIGRYARDPSFRSWRRCAVLRYVRIGNGVVAINMGRHVTPRSHG